MNRFRQLFSVALVLLMLVVPLTAQQIVFPYVSNDANPVRVSGNFVGTATTTIFNAQAAAVRIFLTMVQCIPGTIPSANGINSNTNIGPNLVTLRDGGNNVTGGTIVAYLPCYGMTAPHPVYFVPPLKLSAATALYASIGTSSTTTYIFAEGYTSR